MPGAQRFSHQAMATLFEIYCVHADASYAGQAARAAFDLVDRLEQEQSRFVANSDVSRINQLSAGQGTRVSPSTMECLEIARRMYDVTAPGLRHLDRLRAATASSSFRTGSSFMPAPTGCGSTSAASARATRSTAWRSCSKSGKSTMPSCTVASARSSPWRLRRSGTGGRSP